MVLCCFCFPWFFRCSRYAELSTHHLNLACAMLLFLLCCAVLLMYQLLLISDILGAVDGVLVIDLHTAC